MNTTTALLERWFWLAISLVLAIFILVVRWILEQPESRFTEQITTWRTRPEANWIIHTARLLYALGIPALAFLWRGVLTERGLGLKPWPWVKTNEILLAQYGAGSIWELWMQDIGWHILFASIFWAIIQAGDYTRKQLITNTHQKTQKGHSEVLREAIYHQIHWAFYREPFVLVFGYTRGTWLGLLPIAIEALINPAWWAKLRSPHHSRDIILRIGLAILSALLYIKTQNLWLAILTDTLLNWIL